MCCWGSWQTCCLPWLCMQSTVRLLLLLLSMAAQTVTMVTATAATAAAGLGTFQLAVSPWWMLSPAAATPGTAVASPEGMLCHCCGLVGS
ncbi:hypothetical protein COO60DRAFT_1487959 [Scenedesmus sp. NREL 46B-D3]|nr:hypothetical protein COO60DRAFT_1487959 [Scenedesmus sp. NREL 46B-D3]